jgi:hypothetical protein
MDVTGFQLAISAAESVLPVVSKELQVRQVVEQFGSSET